VVWQVDGAKCINSRLGEGAAEACRLCTDSCVVAQSAVRAVNDFSKCGRCNICPAYFNIKSAVDAHGLPSEKRCPRDRHHTQAHRFGRPPGSGQQLLRIRNRRKEV
jgi:hypothetical protein